MNQTIKRSKRGEHYLVFSELEYDIKQQGDKLKIDVIIITTMVRRMRKSFRNNNLVVQQQIKIPWFQAQEHQLRITRNSWRFDPLGKRLAPRQDHHEHKRKGGSDSLRITLKGDEELQEEDEH
jgi:hypothetical protein